MRVNRRGATLVELLVALTLGSVVVGLLASSVSAQRRIQRAHANARDAASAVDETVRVVTASLAMAVAEDSVALRGDTAVEWRAVVGVSVACYAGADSVIVPDAGDATWWDGVPTAGDELDVLADSTHAISVEVTAVSVRSGGGACGAAHRSLRLATAMPFPADPVAVRVTRRKRLMLYRSGDNAWWMGERICASAPPHACGAAQPIAGPLAPPPDGLRFSADSGPGFMTVIVRAMSGGAWRAGQSVITR